MKHKIQTLLNTNNDCVNEHNKTVLFIKKLIKEDCVYLLNVLPPSYIFDLLDDNVVSIKYLYENHKNTFDLLLTICKNDSDFFGAYCNRLYFLYNLYDLDLDNKDLITFVGYIFYIDENNEYIQDVLVRKLNVNILNTMYDTNFNQFKHIIETHNVNYLKTLNVIT